MLTSNEPIHDCGTQQCLHSFGNIFSIRAFFRKLLMKKSCLKPTTLFRICCQYMLNSQVYYTNFKRHFSRSIYKNEWVKQPWFRGMQMFILGCLHTIGWSLNPSNAEATFIQSTMMQRFLKTILTLSCWFSLESSRWVLSDEYPYAEVSLIFQFFCIILHILKLATSSMCWIGSYQSSDIELLSWDPMISIKVIIKHGSLSNPWR